MLTFSCKPDNYVICVALEEWMGFDDIVSTLHNQKNLDIEIDKNPHTMNDPHGNERDCVVIKTHDTSKLFDIEDILGKSFSFEGPAGLHVPFVWFPDIEEAKLT